MSDNHKRMDAAAADAYEKNLSEGREPWVELGMKLAAPQPGEHVLDVACGTGIGARLAATSVTASGRVVGVDIDPAMIEVARRISPSLEWHCASALDMPFEDATFDLSLCLCGLHFFPDCAAGLAEIRRVLKPTGRLVASVRAPLEFNKGHHVFIVALERRSIDASTAREAYSLSDPEKLRGAAKRGGFVNVEIRTEDGLSHYRSMQAFIDAMVTGSYVLRRAVALLPEDGRSKFSEEVSAMLQPYVLAGRLALPTRLHILFARP